MKDNIYTIGEVADLVNISIKDIRHFEYKQLISPSFQGEYNHNLYNEEDLKKLKFIVTMYKNGFTIEDILEEVSED